jgi:NADPH:quinone reductase-like Zn-dependent oxidoreductase
MFDDMNQAIVHHSIRPVIDQVVDFEEAKDAFSEMQNANHFGKLVIKI